MSKNITLIALIKTILPITVNDKKFLEVTIHNFQKSFTSLNIESQSKLKKLIFVIQVLCLVTNFKFFHNLNQSHAVRFLTTLENFPLPIIRAGFVGLRSLILISFYTDSTSWPMINYHGPLVTIDE